MTDNHFIERLRSTSHTCVVANDRRSQIACNCILTFSVPSRRETYTLEISNFPARPPRAHNPSIHTPSALINPASLSSLFSLFSGSTFSDETETSVSHSRSFPLSVLKLSVFSDVTTCLRRRYHSSPALMVCVPMGGWLNRLRFKNARVRAVGFRLLKSWRYVHLFLSNVWKFKKIEFWKSINVETGGLKCRFNHPPIGTAHFSRTFWMFPGVINLVEYHAVFHMIIS